MNHENESLSKTQARQDFLANKWSRYPVAPHAEALRGRIQDIRENSFRLEADSEFISCSLEMMKYLIPGDWISVERQGTQAVGLTLLAPCLAELPENLSPSKFKKHQQFQNFLQIVRDYFREQGFSEIQTPSLVPCPGTEPYLDVFSTEFVQGSRSQKMYLPTSPELHLKKALALGASQIFEIKPCFRNGEIGPTHSPEFLMLEWYRSFSDLEQIKKDVAKLVDYVCEQMHLASAKPQEIRNTQMAALFQKYVDLDLKPTTTSTELQKQCQKIGVSFSSDDSFDDLFFRLYLEKIEPELQGHDLQFVCDYPPSQAALARLTKEGWGDRFEVYWQGMEIANAFHELNDPEIQKLRFREDLQKKRELGKEDISLDDEFMQLLLAGMPPSAGIALGLERLFMAITGTKNISDFQIFPYSDLNL